MSSRGEKVLNVAAGIKQGVSSKLRDIWWILMLRGLLALGLATCAMFWPQQTMGLLVKLLGTYFIIDGMASIIGSWRSGGRGSSVVEAVVSLAAGLALFFWTGISAKLFLLLVGIWAVFQGASLFLSSRSMDPEDQLRGLVGIIGVFVSIIGLVFIFWPDTGVTAISWLIALGSLVVGVLLVYLATRLSRVRSRIEKIGT